MTLLDRYIQSQVAPLLQPGEHVLHMCTMRRQPGLFVQILLVGGLLLMLLTKTYFVVLTNRRLILILTKASFWSGTPKPMNLGVEEYDARAIKAVTTSGFANNRSMTFHLPDRKLELRISPWFKSVSGTKDFFEQVPTLIQSGQLATGQLPAAPPAPPQHGAPGAYVAPPQYGAPAAYAAPPQHGAPAAQAAPPQYGAPAAYAAPYAPPPPLGPGARVLVLAPDGHRYPGTLVHQQGEHCLCAMQNGQFWFPAGSVSPA